MADAWPTAVLVDLDNTLHDYRGAARRARSALARSIAERHGVPEHTVLARYEQLLLEEKTAMRASGREMRVARLERLLATWPETRTAEAGALADLLAASLLDGIRAFPGALEAYRTIAERGRTLIVTEGYEDTQRAIAERLGLPTDPAALLVTGASGVTKRDGSAFRVAGELVGAGLEELVMVGDNWTWDILGAAHAGLWQLWVAAPGQLRTELPDRHLGRVSAFSEAPAFLAARWPGRST